MSLQQIEDVYSHVRRSWPAARTPSELRREIALLEGLLEELNGDQADGSVADLTDQISDLQDALRLELAGRGIFHRRHDA